MTSNSSAMGFRVEENTAVYKVKNIFGSYDVIQVNDHHVDLDSLGQSVSKYIKAFHIQSGLTLYTIDFPAEIEFTMKFMAEECPIGFGITRECDLHSDFFKGDEKLYTQHKKTDSLLITKTSHMLGTSEKKRGKRAQAISIAFDPNLFKVLYKDELPLMKPEFAPLFDETNDFFELNIKASPMMLAIASSILDFKQSPQTKTLFIKSKTFELINLIFSEVMLTNEGAKKRSVLQPGEIDVIKNVRKYILSNIDTPLTIKELARIHGINDFKLKSGFKEVFGTTVFGCLQNARMEKAKLMLETGRHSVSEIAWDVGYTNVSHFIRAFKKTFDTTPGQILCSIKHSLTRNII